MVYILLYIPIAAISDKPFDIRHMVLHFMLHLAYAMIKLLHFLHSFLYCVNLLLFHEIFFLFLLQAHQFLIRRYRNQNPCIEQGGNHRHNPKKYRELFIKLYHRVFIHNQQNMKNDIYKQNPCYRGQKHVTQFFYLQLSCFFLQKPPHDAQHNREQEHLQHRNKSIV